MCVSNLWASFKVKFSNRGQSGMESASREIAVGVVIEHLSSGSGGGGGGSNPGGIFFFFSKGVSLGVGPPFGFF